MVVAGGAGGGVYGYSPDGNPAGGFLVVVLVVMVPLRLMDCGMPGTGAGGGALEMSIYTWW